MKKRIPRNPVAISKRRRAARPAAPVTFHSDGRRYAGLSEHLDESIPTLPPAALSHEHWRRITQRRIRAQPDFGVYHVGHGLVRKGRAAEEVRKGSDLGRVLVEVERRHVLQLIDDAEAQKRRKRGNKSR